VRALANWLISAVLLAACAAPPPRAQVLADLERRAGVQRARSAAIERRIGQLETAPVPPAPAEGTVPYYERVSLRSSEPIDSRYAPELRAQLAKALADSGSSSLVCRASEEQQFAPPWEGQEFPGVSLAALFAASYAAGAQFRGAEFDVRVALAPGPDRLVTVIHEVDGRVSSVEAEAREPRESGPGPEADALRARYGIGPVDGWSGPERASLDRSLAVLRPEERALLAGLPFRRKSGGVSLPFIGGQARHCGHFELELEQRSIAIYDCAFGADAHGFVGSLERPLRPSVRVILHEIGHALFAAPLASLLADVVASQREAQQMVEDFNRLGRRVERHEVERVRELQDEIQALQGDLTRWHEQLRGVDYMNTAAGRAFLRLEGASSGFTPYGRTSPVEGFAEAFSLCRSDPEAGRRISAAVCDFFESDWMGSPAQSSAAARWNIQKDASEPIE
jgi:hypothetical protein